MVLILDDNSEIGVPVRSNLWYLICLRHLIRSRHRTLSESSLIKVPRVALICEYYGICAGGWGGGAKYRPCQRRVRQRRYCMSKKFCPFLCGEYTMISGHDFLDLLYTRTADPGLTSLSKKKWIRIQSIWIMRDPDSADFDVNSGLTRVLIFHGKKGHVAHAWRKIWFEVWTFGTGSDKY